jgi:hypothetical protein
VKIELGDAGVNAAREAITVFRAASPKLPWSAATSGAVPDVRNGTTIATLLIVAAVIGILLLRSL